MKSKPVMSHLLDIEAIAEWLPGKAEKIPAWTFPLKEGQHYNHKRHVFAPLPNPTTNTEGQRFRLCVPSFGRGLLWSLALLTNGGHILSVQDDILGRPGQ